MLNACKRILSLLLCCAMIAALAVPALAASFDDYKDTKGHWAEVTLRQAYQDGILNGYNNVTMAPNDSVTVAQALTILCRVMHVSGRADTSALNLPTGAWYADAAAKGLYFGLIEEKAQNFNAPISRADAFVMFGRVFQTTQADPDNTAINRFPDSALLEGEPRRATASLVNYGIVGGNNGKLLPDSSLTRAEFATILYRIASQFGTVSESEGFSGGMVLTGSGVLSGTANNVWLDCASSGATIYGSHAKQLVIRSNSLTDFSLYGNGHIGRLVLANQSGDFTLNLPDTYSLNTFCVGQGGGAVTFSGQASQAEVTGDGRTITLNSPLDKLTVSGNHNKIVLSSSAPVGTILISGTGNTVQINGKTDQLVLAGRDNSIRGTGRITKAVMQTRYYSLTTRTDLVEQWKNYNMDGVTAKISTPSVLKAGETLQATATLTVPENNTGKICTASWYLNGELTKQEKILLGHDTPTASFKFQYTHDLKRDNKVSFTLSYVNHDGDAFSTSDSSVVQVENFEDLGLADATVSIQAPSVLAAGQKLQASAVIDSPETGKNCTATWYVDGKQVSTQKITLGGTNPTVSFSYDYYYGRPVNSTITCKVSYTTKDGRKQEISSSTDVKVENYPDNGIANATISLSTPATLGAGKTLSATAKVNYLEAGKVCTATWYVDDKQVSTQKITLGSNSPTLSHQFTYSENMKLSSTVKLILSYTTQDGRKQEISATTTLALENYGYSYYHKPNTDVLKLVTSKYIGNYTLKWAQTHDYTPEVKTDWVNLKGYASKTKYLIWVNLTYQRVNIFSGYQGNWYLVRQCLCGSGKNSTPTIRGVFTTSYKQTAWSYGSYYCGPVVRFNGSSGYAFHSRLEYYPMNSDRYYDARIGFPISHGCLRMYNDDIWYIYNNIPSGTTVVVY